MVTEAPKKTVQRKPMIEYIEVSPQQAEKYLSSPLDQNSLRLVEILKQRKPVLATGCGTSYHMAILAARYLEVVCGIDARAVPSFDLEKYRPTLVNGKILLAISHSGATKETLEAVARARNCSPECIVSISFGDSTPLAKAADLHLCLPGGFEEAFPKTMTYNIGALQLLRIALEVRAEKSNGHSPAPDSKWVSAAMQKALDENRAVMDRAASDWSQIDGFYFAGGGPAWNTAIEIALKMRENNYTSSQGFEIEEISHGTMSALGPEKALILIALRGASIARTGDVLQAAKHIGTHTLVVAEEGVDLPVQPDYLARIPAAPSEEIGALLADLPLQFFSNQISIHKGVDPDSLRLEHPEFHHAEYTWIFPPGSH